MGLRGRRVEQGGKQVERSLSEAVLAAVAEREEVAVSALETPLYDAVDPEALDSLFRGTTGEITFDYLGYHITALAEGRVELSPTS